MKKLKEEQEASSSGGGGVGSPSPAADDNACKGCGKPVTPRICQSTSKGNQGRRFYKCDDCGKFVWLSGEDAPLPTPTIENDLPGKYEGQ